MSGEEWLQRYSQPIVVYYDIRFDELNLNHGRLSPREWWKPPTPDGPRRELWHDIHACIISSISRFVGARRNGQSSDNDWGSKAPKNRRRRGRKAEKFEIYHYSRRAQIMQWLKWFINTGEVLLKICHSLPKLHTIPISFSPLSLSLSLSSP